MSLIFPNSADNCKGLWDCFKWRLKRGSWGRHATKLIPDSSTGRSGFYIHGGSSPGSAGCIDLTSYNDAFHNWLKTHDGPITVIVDYPNYPYEENFP